MRHGRDRLPIVTLETPTGLIRVELADTPAARANGLAGRDAFTEVDGLLLKWEPPERHPIWMKGMRFALDLVSLDADGHVAAALTNMPPCRAEPCPLNEPDGTARSGAVLEIRAGGAAAHRPTIDAVVRSSFASQRPDNVGPPQIRSSRQLPD
jgi:uncharacterized membrane protein (UPF0127 family)